VLFPGVVEIVIVVLLMCTFLQGGGRWTALPADEHGVLRGKRVLLDLPHEGTAAQVGGCSVKGSFCAWVCLCVTECCKARGWTFLTRAQQYR
jgi:hypothetical protein